MRSHDVVLLVIVEMVGSSATIVIHSFGLISSDRMVGLNRAWGLEGVDA